MFATDDDSNFDLIVESFQCQDLFLFETEIGCSASNKTEN